MSTFVMLTRLAPTAVHSPDDLKALETKAVAAVKEYRARRSDILTAGDAWQEEAEAQRG
jgi:hypothetical protein